MSDYTGGTSGTAEASSTKGVEMGTSSGIGGGECCDGEGVGAENGLKAISVKPGFHQV